MRAALIHNVIPWRNINFFNSLNNHKYLKKINPKIAKNVELAPFHLDYFAV